MKRFAGSCYVALALCKPIVLRSSLQGQPPTERFAGLASHESAQSGSCLTQIAHRSSFLVCGFAENNSNTSCSRLSRGGGRKSKLLVCCCCCCSGGCCCRCCRCCGLEAWIPVPGPRVPRELKLRSPPFATVSLCFLVNQVTARNWLTALCCANRNPLLWKSDFGGCLGVAIMSAIQNTAPISHTMQTWYAITSNAAYHLA